jgi:hypothetical protein
MEFLVLEKIILLINIFNCKMGKEKNVKVVLKDMIQQLLMFKNKCPI